MAKHLTDKQKKRIIADYVELGSYNAVAKKHMVSVDTVKRTVLRDNETAQKAKQKKEENTLDMLAYMDSKKTEAQGIIDLYLKALVDPKKLEKAPLSQIATSLGIVVDKFTRNTANGGSSLDKLDGLLKEFKDAVESETT